MWSLSFPHATHRPGGVGTAQMGVFSVTLGHEQDLARAQSPWMQPRSHQDDLAHTSSAIPGL